MQKLYIDSRFPYHVLTENGKLFANTENMSLSDAECRKRAQDIVAAFAALASIAATSLWGEPIANADAREELRAQGQYDDSEGYQPSADDESTLLRDAVEEARKALGLPLSVEMPESEA